MNTSAENTNRIFLTFDDGPSDRVTPVVLDVLKEKKVNATFFVVGASVTTRSRIIKRMAEEGNSVGIHSYSHNYSQIYKTPATLIEDIKKCSSLLECIGIKTKLYRFPGGSHMVNKNFIEEVTNHGYRYVDWNSLCGDSEWATPTIEQLYKRAIYTANDRREIIMLFHDSTDKSITAQTLPLIIDYYQSEHYEFCTFDMI